MGEIEMRIAERHNKNHRARPAEVLLCADKADEVWNVFNFGGDAQSRSTMKSDCEQSLLH